MRARFWLALAITATVAMTVAVTSGIRVRAQQSAARAFSAAGSTAALRQVDADVTALVRRGDLTPLRVEQDPLLDGVSHERYRQSHVGVPVWGTMVVRQIARTGEPVSVFGDVRNVGALSTTPRLTAEAATALVEQAAGVRLGESKRARLVVLPRDDGSHVLAYTARAVTPDARLMRYFVDAATGAIVASYDETMHQAPVGTGRGVLGDAKKMSTQALGAAFVANDMHRPPVLQTYDMRGELLPVLEFLNGLRPLRLSDFATDTDNNWTDGAVVDAHVYAGWTYDYLFKRHNRRGLNNADGPVISLVNPVRREDIFLYPPVVASLFFVNAAYWGDGLMTYGVGLPDGFTLGGQRFNHFQAALDIVAHELTHGVTEYSSNLLYRDEPGALNESFSDIIAASTEFYFQAPGSGSQQADYIMGEDAITPGAPGTLRGTRSLASPATYGDPDHYSLRYQGTGDNGGIHINSSIPNHAFYLAIEGGQNRVSGLTVQGVGAANREQIEKVFYRAFVFMLPSTATFATAREATIQSARDLYGSGSAAERAVTQAWTAVGVL